ncbi:MAG: bifunctional 5,10-methylenetetrahydrofolate dehydrogenase/5,10-methenyltetrahydrofolate cyclohydrolase [Lachnospiraceae bacterium]|nr:bifunctional 5,10-methylenetetrahydrofolate dehydrogenase/5,10-methenyltetrahydrofolate cyclohydrolase [Lachnospiraceae bacterium]
MARLLKGAPVTEALTKKTAERAAALKERGIEPTLLILRIGEREDDLVYEKGIRKRCGLTGVTIRETVFPESVSAEELIRSLEEAGTDDSVHGILLFRPLPKGLDEEEVLRHFPPEKDVDGCTEASCAGVFMGKEQGFAPCTAEAVMELLSFYGIDPKGKRAVVLGRSLVIGRPVAMLLMHKHATVTICHTRTKDPDKEASRAELLISAVGKAGTLTLAFTNPDQVIVDVGINWDEAAARIVGDADFDAVEPRVAAITPVPGGVGSVTTAVLCSHVVRAAERS